MFNTHLQPIGQNTPDLFAGTDSLNDKIEKFRHAQFL